VFSCVVFHLAVSHNDHAKVGTYFGSAKEKAKKFYMREKQKT
jgi:hypothetical protein